MSYIKRKCDVCKNLRYTKRSYYCNESVKQITRDNVIIPAFLFCDYFKRK